MVIDYISGSNSSLRLTSLLFVVLSSSHSALSRGTAVANGMSGILGQTEA